MVTIIKECSFWELVKDREDVVHGVTKNQM